MRGPALGTKLVFPPPGRWDGPPTCELTEAHGVAVWSGVPTQFWRLLRHADLDRYDLSALPGSGGRRPLPARAARAARRAPPWRGRRQRLRDERDRRAAAPSTPGRSSRAPRLGRHAQIGGEVRSGTRSARRPGGRGRRDPPPLGVGVPRLLGRTPRRPRVPRRRAAGTAPATSAGSGTGCSTWRAACATSSSGAARTSTRSRSSTD